MVTDRDPALEGRVLVAAPTRRDARVTCELLERAGIACESFAELPPLATAVHEGVGAIMLTDAALAAPGMDLVFAALACQPDWSDIPVILLTPERQQASDTSRALDAFTNVTLLERPVSTRSMLSAVMAALRARRRQYQIRDQMAELRLAEAALRQADRRKDEFLATLAHELRNPLAPIRTGLDLLERLPDGPQAAQVRSMMQRQLNLLIKLIDDLLDVSRIATGKVLLQREVVDLRTVVESAIEGSGPMVSAGSHRLHVHLPPQPVGVRVDALRMAQVVGNLVNNAAKYTPAGGRIEVALAAEGDEAVVRVSDNGVGIPADMLEHVFDMFAQVDLTRDQSQGGLGIGLSLVQRLVNLHGGRVSAESAGRDRGSTFTIRLPRVAMPADPAERSASGDGSTPAANVQAGADAEHALPRRARPRVLVVDDNVDAADSLAIVLEIEGCETRVEYNATEGLRAAAEFQPRAIVCDIGLPLVDGHEFARRLRADPLGEDTLLVALTGLGSDDDKRRTRDAGFDFHLVKPVDLAAVRDILARL
jgi:signal transduction histidine kinase